VLGFSLRRVGVHITKLRSWRRCALGSSVICIGY
jgi:hypothetical protein